MVAKLGVQQLYYMPISLHSLIPQSPTHAQYHPSLGESFI